MTLKLLLIVLGWCSVINLGLLTIWLLLFLIAHDFIYNLHNRWFKIPVETFDSIHYCGMLFFKIVILFFNIIPYLVLRIAL